MTISDEETAALVRSLVESHGRAVEALLRTLERDHQARQDLWSEVFATAYVRIDQLVDLDDDQARGWLLRTARNHCANNARRATTRRRLASRLAADRPEPEPSAEDLYFGDRHQSSERDLDSVQEAWEALSDSHRQVLVLDAHGHDGPAIARHLGVSAAAARSRLMRARRAFLDLYHEPKHRPR